MNFLIRITTKKSYQLHQSWNIAKKISTLEIFIYFSKDMLILQGLKTIKWLKTSLFICLRELTSQWYINKTTSNVKILINYAFDIKHWSSKFFERFKEKSNVAFLILMKKEYAFEDTKNQIEFREYAFIILKTFKFINFTVLN